MFSYISKAFFPEKITLKKFIETELHQKRDVKTN